MIIQDLFTRSITRPINGVVKADQLDEALVWQELEEFVVTQELVDHLDAVVDVLQLTLDSPETTADRNGIWVSGFFGCGKSHFIKVMSYLLQNAEHHYDGKRQRAIKFFEDKLKDNALLWANLKKAVAANTETILFNIESKADHRQGRDTLLHVFLKVLNEAQGYCGDYPHIAHMERHLDEQGKLGDFHDAFKRAAGSEWREERDAWEFHRDEVSLALQQVLGQSKESVEAWVEGAETNFSLTVENFARWVKRYLERNESVERVMFLVDEVGQFIGQDNHLMLSLQTITEDLCTICEGRAWVVVTSQEELDTVLGDLNRTNDHDFSKIQGRFKTRLSLSSRNVDEVIKKRLLDKRPEAGAPLAAAYKGKHDILKNQLGFAKASMSLKAYTGTEDFAACYPFAAYQFELVQKVFEAIRRAGATGIHLAQGERSTLDAFQGAARELKDKEIGVLVPFYAFYPSVEGFLDTAVKRTIDRARSEPGLEAFDATVLEVLFLIRYIDELPGSVDNLVTLCVNEIDSDRLALRKQIVASLERLERHTHIARNGELFFFLTNEERDISNEIKSTKVPSGAEERELGKLLFEDMLGDMRSHSYGLTGKAFTFTRTCDEHPIGKRLDGSLEVAFVSPLGERYAELADDQRAIMHSNLEQQQVLIRLPDDSSLGRELRTYLQTEDYVRTRHTGTLPETTKRILRDRSDENRARRRRLVETSRTLLANATFFASGKRLDIKSRDPREALAEALEYLIQNAYPKMGYIEHLSPNLKAEIQSTLRANDVEQVSLAVKSSQANPRALDDLRQYLQLSNAHSKQIVLYDLIDKRYGRRPYGWPELEVVLLVARLAVLKEVQLIVNAAPLSLDQAYEHLVASSKQRQVIIRQREAADGGLVKKAQNLGKDLFSQQGPGAEDTLFQFLQAHLVTWKRALQGHEPLARTGNYPGGKEIGAGLALLRKFVDDAESLRFLKRFVAARDELLDLADDMADLNDFYGNQKHAWESLQKAVADLLPNRLQLDADAKARPALARMGEILASERPYRMIHEVAGLVHTAETVNTALIEEARAPVQKEIEQHRTSIQADLEKINADTHLHDQATGLLQKLMNEVQTTTSIAHIVQARVTAERAFDAANKAIDMALRETPEDPGPDVDDENGHDDEDSTPAPTPKPKIKVRRTVEAKTCWAGDYIESAEDVEVFLSTLRDRLEAAIAANERVRIK